MLIQFIGMTTSGAQAQLEDVGSVLTGDGQSDADAGKPAERAWTSAG